MSQHSFRGEITGNPYQQLGKHRAFHMDKGCGFIPLGDRHREDVFKFGDHVLEERMSVDIATSKRR